MSWSLRELLARYQATQYEATRRVSEIVAALYNVQRTSKADPVYSYLDFHPAHVNPTRVNGREKLQRIAAVMAPGMVWDEAHKPEGF